MTKIKPGCQLGSLHIMHHISTGKLQSKNTQPVCENGNENIHDYDNYDDGKKLICAAMRARSF
jgi:hypothetical protein